MKKNKIDKESLNKVDWMVTLLPLISIVLLCILFIFIPNKSNDVLSKIIFKIWKNSFRKAR